MISLKPDLAPFDLVLCDGVTLKLKPMTTVSRLIAEARARQFVDRLVEGLDVCLFSGLVAPVEQDLRDDAVRLGVLQNCIIRECAADHILDWTGVVDSEGRPSPVTPEAARAVVYIFPYGEKIYDALMEHAHKVASAKKE